MGWNRREALLTAISSTATFLPPCLDSTLHQILIEAMPPHATYSNDDSKLLQDAFTDLCIEETVSPYDNIAGVIEEPREGVSPTISL